MSAQEKGKQLSSIVIRHLITTNITATILSVKSNFSSSFIDYNAYKDENWTQTGI